MRHILDYDALTEPLTEADIDAYKQAYGIRGGSKAFAAIFITSTAIIIAIIFIVIRALSHSDTSIAVGLSLSVLSAVVIMITIFALEALVRRWQIGREARLYKLASRNGLQLIKNVSIPAYKGMIFDRRHSGAIVSAFRFYDGTEFGKFVYVTGYGKNRQVHSWVYVKMKLTRRLPHMLLDAKHNNFLKRISNFDNVFSSSQVLSLEGDFDNYFTLYVPKQYERDALYVFTPNVMEAMINYGKSYDIEIVDDELYIYTNDHSFDKVELIKPLLEVADTISGRLIAQTDYYADERTGDRALNEVSQKGRRLKSGTRWSVVIHGLMIIGTILFYIFLVLFSRQ